MAVDSRTAIIPRAAQILPRAWLGVQVCQQCDQNGGGPMLRCGGCKAGAPGACYCHEACLPRSAKAQLRRTCQACFQTLGGLVHCLSASRPVHDSDA